jgi:osmotically-inducible protein OsmY
MRSDSEIQQRVMSELKWDTRVKETDVGVEVDGGVVTLTGHVPTWPMRKAAAEAAHRVSGVVGVANDIEVKVPGVGPRTDTEITDAVVHALAWDISVPKDRVTCTVSGGAVTLEGDVELWSEREAAEQAVENLSGVRVVFNRIRVKPVVSAPALDLRRSIVEALERQAEREAKHLRVDINGGTVTISGTVRSMKERDAILGAAFGTRGVSVVVNELHVRPYAP